VCVVTVDIIHADCLDAMRAMRDGCVDAIVSDPPYGLAFMGREWDHGVPGVPFWSEALRVAKPGAYLVAFGGTRTYHRLACAIEDAGWEVRDCLSWLYGSGFPKSLDVSKAIDAAAGAEREVVGSKHVTRVLNPEDVRAHNYAVGLVGRGGEVPITAPATEAAKQWAGWGTALKPAWEPAILARKPLIGTVAANVLAHGTGALNVDGCRIEWAHAGEAAEVDARCAPNARGALRPGAVMNRPAAPTVNVNAAGRWPANVLLDEEAAAALDAQTGVTRSTGGQASLGAFRGGRVFGAGRDEREARDPGYGDVGGASRFFYTAKASKRERGEGNTHPTVKPLSLMRWIVRLVTPPGGVVLDPFAGSGTTGLAAQAEGMSAILVEREAEYVEIIRRRLAEAEPAQLDLGAA
jgi:hypothetical protein